MDMGQRSWDMPIKNTPAMHNATPLKTNVIGGTIYSLLIIEINDLAGNTTGTVAFTFRTNFTQ